jgi:site-specific DNA recombinase
MIATGYARVSTAQQSEEGISLEAQEAMIRAWATSKSYELRAIEVDAGISGKRADNRPALLRALDAVCADRGVLVVYSLSRFARSTKDALAMMERLQKSGANLVSLTESIDTTTAMGTFVFTLLAALAKLERDLISERTRMALAHKRSKGESTGGDAPYGSRVRDGKLVTNDDEFRVILMMRSMRVMGKGSTLIARELNDLGLYAREGPWHSKSVRRILLRERVA